MSRQLLAILALALILGAGVFAFYWQNRQQEVVTSLPMPPVVEESEESTASYSQHIEAIPGNTDEVWYNIPEYGVRMKLNRGFAEDLIYSDGMIDDFGKPQEGIYFSTKAISEVAPECAPKRGGAFGVLSNIEGTIEEADRNGLGLGSEWYMSKLKAGEAIQFSDFFVVWSGPQAPCWFVQHRKLFERVWPKSYLGIGVKNMVDGARKVELIPQK